MWLWAWKRWPVSWDTAHLSFLKLCRIEKKPKLILKQRFSCQALCKARKVYLKSEVITEKIGDEIVFHHLVLLRHNLVWIDGILPDQVSPLKKTNTHVFAVKHTPWEKDSSIFLKEGLGVIWQAKNNYKEKIVIARNVRQVFLKV